MRAAKSPPPRTRAAPIQEYENTIYALTAAINTKDHYTFNHSENVAYYATALAEACQLNGDYVEMIREAPCCMTSAKSVYPSISSTSPAV